MLTRRRNLAAMLFRLESCRKPERVAGLVRTLVEWLKGPEEQGLRRAFAVWLDKVIFARLSAEQHELINELWEKPTMLSEQFDVWEKEFIEKGIRKGIRKGTRKGIQKGRQEGQAILLTRLLRKRFGKLPETLRDRLRSARPNQLERWAERVLEAATLDEIFRMKRVARA